MGVDFTLLILDVPLSREKQRVYKVLGISLEYEVIQRSSMGIDYWSLDYIALLQSYLTCVALITCRRRKWGTRGACPPPIKLLGGRPPPQYIGPSPNANTPPPPFPSKEIRNHVPLPHVKWAPKYISCSVAYATMDCKLLLHKFISYIGFRYLCVHIDYRSAP